MTKENFNILTEVNNFLSILDIYNIINKIHFNIDIIYRYTMLYMYILIQHTTPRKGNSINKGITKKMLYKIIQHTIFIGGAF